MPLTTPIARGCEIQAAAHELTAALSFGGEPGERKALRLAALILREAQAIQRDLDGKRAA